MSKALSNKTKLNNVVDVVADFGADPTGAVICSSALQACHDTLTANQTMYFPPGNYVGKLKVTKSNINILGAGSGSVTLKMPPGVDGNVLEIGNIDVNVKLFDFTGNVSGITLDGSRANTPSPALLSGSYDLTGWGFCVSYGVGGKFSDIRGINCWNGGTGFFLCNNVRGDAYVANSGFNPNLSNPGFDTNGCKYSQFNFISNACNIGGRMTDATYGCKIDGQVYNATLAGFMTNVQAVASNYTEASTVNVNIVGGCSQAAMTVTGDVRGCTFNATINGITGVGVIESVAGGYTPTGNTYNFTTQLGSKQSGTFAGTKGTVNAKSISDAQGSAAGTYYAYEVTGSYNIFNVLVQADATPLIRGLNISGNYNVFNTFERNTLVSNVNDAGTANRIANPYLGMFKAPTFTNSFVNALTAPNSQAGYTLTPDNWVVLDGTISGGVLNSSAFTLPAGYVPTQTRQFSVRCNGATQGVIEVNNTGQIVPRAGATNWTLDGIRFPVGM